MAATKVPTSQINDTYSTSEQNTGKVWVDGRPIYRKVIRGQMNVVAGSVNIAHGISGITTSLELINVGGGIKLGGGSVSAGSTMQSFQYREAGGNWISLVSVDGTNVVFTSSFAWGNSYYAVTLEYVK